MLNPSTADTSEDDPTGPKNDDHIVEAVETCGMIRCYFCGAERQSNDEPDEGGYWTCLKCQRDARRTHQ